MKPEDLKEIEKIVEKQLKSVYIWLVAIWIMALASWLASIHK